MSYKNWPIAKQIGALAFLLSLCIFSIVGVSSYMVATAIFTEKGESNIESETHRIADLLELQYKSLLAIASRNADVFKTMYPQEFTLSDEKVTVVDQQVPVLLHNNQAVNNDMTVVDEYAKLTRGNATVFVRDGDDFFRIATSLKKDNGQRAVGTYLGKKHPGYQTLMSGETYEGYAQLFGNEYMTVYKPIMSSANKVIGILYIGFNINDSMSSLRETVKSLVIEETGHIFIFNNATNAVIVAKNAEPNSAISSRLLEGIEPEQIKQNTPFYYTNKAGKSMFSYSEIIDGWNWSIIARVDADELDDESIQLMKVNGITSVVGIAMITALLSWVLVKTLTPLKQLSQTVDRLGNGDLSQQLSNTDKNSHNEVDQITTSVSAMADELRKLIFALQSSIVQLESHAVKSQTEAQTNGQEAHEMMAQTEQIATAIEQMSNSIKDVANNANESAERTGQVDKDAQSGRTQLNQVIKDLMLLSEQLNASHQAVEKVNTASNEISKVTEVINAIAEQTNLLALNAAIEAARAGEQGRGFAVVADEVRTLAQRTQKSIIEISTTIEQLQTQVNTATQQMQQSQQLGIKSADEGKQTGEQLNLITASIGDLTRSSSNIAEATEQQSTVANDITQNLHLISQLAKDAESRTEGTIYSADELIQLANKIKQQISFFKVN